MRRVFRRVVTVVLILIGGGLAYGVARAFDEAFQRHSLLFLFLWVFIPATSWWFVRNYCMEDWTREPKTVRLLATLAVIAVSLACNHHYLRFERQVGHFLVDGYEVEVHEADTGEGSPEVVATIHSEHWYTTCALYLLRLLSVATEFMLAAVTWSVLTPQEKSPAQAPA